MTTPARTARLFTLLGALGLGAFAFAPAALAEPAAKPAKKKDDKKTDGKATAKDAKATKATKGPAKEAEREGPAKMSTAPQGGDLEMEAAADKKRDEEIEQLKKIIPKIPKDNPQRADLLFRLAERWYDKSKYVYFQEVREYDKVYGAFLEAQKKGEKASEPRLTTKKSDAYKGDAMRLYEQILEEYPRYERNDEVLFNLAYNSYETGKKKEGVEKYWQLIKQFPKSQLVPDAYLQMGEHFFVSNDLVRAKTAYEKAKESKKPKIYSFALYKLAWCDYNAGEFDGAYKKFREVVDYAEKAAAGGDKDRIQLKFEALRDLVKTFVALDAVDEAARYWSSHTTKERTRELTKKLADAFFDAGKFEGTVKTYRLLINSNPNDPDAPGFQNAIVLAYDKLNRRDDVKREINRLVDLYKPGSDWAKVNEGNKKALASAYDIAESSMRQIVTDYHSEAQKTKSVPTYRAARDIYAKYLDSFADSESAYDLRFYYSDILYSLEEWEKAAEQYEKVVSSNEKDGKYLKEAAYDAILSWEKVVAIAQGKAKATTIAEGAKIDESKSKGMLKSTRKIEVHGKDVKEEEIPKAEQRLIAACDKYVGVAPGADAEKDVRYKSAFAFYDHHHDVEAAKRFGEIIVKWPGDPQARKAADLTLTILNDKEQWADLNRLAREFAQNKKLAGTDKEFTGRLATLIEGSQFKMVLATYEQKDYAKAAPEFRSFVKEFPKSKYADKALYNSLIIYDKAAELDQAIPVAEQLIHDYKESELVPQVVGYLGSFYERIADFRRAAEYYERYADLYGPPDDGKNDIGLDPKAKPGKKEAKKPEPKTAKAEKGKKADKAAAGGPGDGLKRPDKIDEKVASAVPNNLYNAAFWHEGMGDYQKAIAAYSRYIKAFKDRKDVPDLFFNLGLIYERQKDWRRAARIFEDYAKQFEKDLPAGRVFYAKYKALMSYQADGAEKYSKEAMKTYASMIQEYVKLPDAERQKPTAIDAAGHLAFYLAQPVYDDFVKLKFDNPKTLKQVLKSKVAMMSKVEQTYTDVIKYGSPEWGIASLVRIGQAYQDFAKNFIDSPDPKGLDQDQIDMYRSELENRAFPLEEKAVEAYEKALAKSYELAYYNQWTLDAQDRLNKFRPGQYGDLRKVPFQGSEFFATAGFATDLPEVTAPPPEEKKPETGPAKPAAPEPAKKPAEEPKKTGAGAGGY